MTFVDWLFVGLVFVVCAILVYLAFKGVWEDDDDSMDDK